MTVGCGLTSHNSTSSVTSYLRHHQFRYEVSWIRAETSSVLKKCSVALQLDLNEWGPRQNWDGINTFDDSIAQAFFRYKLTQKSVSILVYSLIYLFVILAHIVHRTIVSRWSEVEMMRWCWNMFRHWYSAGLLFPTEPQSWPWGAVHQAGENRQGFFWGGVQRHRQSHSESGGHQDHRPRGGWGWDWGHPAGDHSPEPMWQPLCHQILWLLPEGQSPHAEA